MQESGGCENIPIGFDLDVFGTKSFCEKPMRGVRSEPPIILSLYVAHAFMCNSRNCHKNDASEFQNTPQIVDRTMQIKNQTEDLSANNAIERVGSYGVRLNDIFDNCGSRVVS